MEALHTRGGGGDSASDLKLTEAELSKYLKTVQLQMEVRRNIILHLLYLFQVLHIPQVLKSVPKGALVGRTLFGNAAFKSEIAEFLLVNGQYVSSPSLSLPLGLGSSSPMWLTYIDRFRTSAYG